MDMQTAVAARFAVTMSPEGLARLLQGGDEHLPPANILEALSGEQACATHPGAPYSIATLVGHMTYWQEHCIAWLRGEAGPAAPVDDSINFPQLEPAQWDELQRRFLDSFEQLALLCPGADSTQEHYKGRSLGWFLANQALHNTYHLAQIALLRKLQGNWPAHLSS
jgi:hypothetical protein